MKTLRYKIVIQFNGQNYSGWQIQNEPIITVQLKINKALEVIFKQKIKTTGSGRTDTGVHAKDFHVVFDAPFEIAHPNLVKALNGNLPGDVRVLSSGYVHSEFRPTNDAIEKEYRYYFTTEAEGSPFYAHTMSYVKYPLNFDLMQAACNAFVGEHDFLNFHCVGSEPNSTVRTIRSCELIQCEAGDMYPEHFYIRIIGDGFLKQMVRLIVNAVWDVGRARLEVSDIVGALISKEFKHISAVAPANGLIKYKVLYP